MKPGLRGLSEATVSLEQELFRRGIYAPGGPAMSQTDKLAAPPVLRSESEPALVEETPVRASAESAEAFEEERAVMPANESDAEVARLRRELCARDAADAANSAVLAEKTLRIRELEQEVKHLDDELRSAPATPPRPPPPPPPAKQTPKKKRFSLRNFFGCRDRPG